MTKKPASQTAGTPVAEPGEADQVGEASTEQTKQTRPLTERIQEKLGEAKREMRNNAAPAAAPSARGNARRARLRLTRIDPWSVMKMAFLLSIALGVVMIVAVAIVWGVLGAAGVWDSINRSVQEIVGPDSGGFDVEDYVGTSRILGLTMIVAVVDVVLLTAVATLGAFLYNMAAALLGGLELTFTEDR